MRFWQRILVGVLFSIATSQSFAADVNVTGWSYTLPSTITNAGDYYATILESDLPTTASPDITGLITDTDSWTLKASTIVTGITIAVKRSGIGTGNGTIVGGDNYITLTSAEQTLFTGTGNRSSIPLQFQISGFDVNDGNGNKNIAIQYRITTP